MDLVFTRLIGTLAVILVVSAFIGSSDVIANFIEKGKKWKYPLIAGVLGGAFGVYGNISGFDLRGAVISVRDIGPMLAGFIGGPIGGALAGLIAGIHRLTMGGVTAQACVVATCCIGLLFGLISMKWNDAVRKTYVSFLLGALMEGFHLGIVLLMVKPFETALGIVKQIALPFILINAVGFALMVTIITYTERQRTLLVEKSRLQSELEVASVIQQSLLPAIGTDYPGRCEVDVAADMQAAKAVGGDFYDVFFVDSGHLAFVIGDVSGKGVPAALFMATAKLTLQNCIRDIPDLSQAIAAANNSLCARNEADMFVTLWVGILNLQSGDIRYVGAGHNPPILIRDHTPAYLKSKSGFVLAGMEDMVYKEHSMTLARGDLLYLYTDGVTEANDAHEALFGEARLIRCFEQTDDLTAAQILERVCQNVDDFVQDCDQFDDMTMLCFRYLGPAQGSGAARQP
ncbi:MAG: SpoIIE family protein phosphatase [Clostridia bacterium]|nr:SpoIIE family protein phosphatase [Clostridia bacterium]